MNASDYYDMSLRLYSTWSQMENTRTESQENEAEFTFKNNRYSTVESSDEGGITSKTAASATQNKKNHQTSTNSQQFRPYITGESDNIRSLESERQKYSPLPEKYPTKPENNLPHASNNTTEGTMEQLIQFKLRAIRTGFEKLSQFEEQYRLFKAFKLIAVAQNPKTPNSSKLLNRNEPRSTVGSTKSNPRSQNMHQRGKSQEVLKKNVDVLAASQTTGQLDERVHTKGEHQHFFDKLYQESFLHEQNKILRKELHEIMKMKDCTFSPQINSAINPKSPEISKTLQMPVFERLSTKKPSKAEQMHRRRESKELEEATFQPSINKPHRHTHNPDKASEKKTAAAERLYQDAELKQQVLKLKRDYLKEQELKECTFTPQIISPKFPGSDIERRSRSPAGERLYQDSIKRKQLQSMKDAAKEEMAASQYTFKPQLFTKGHRGSERNKSQERQKEYQNDPANVVETFGDTERELPEPIRPKPADNPFERLYGYAKKKQELMLAQEEEMYQGDRYRDPKIQSPKSIRDQRSVSAQDSRIRRSQSSNSQMFAQLTEPKGSYRQGNTPQSPVFDRLYESSFTKKKKISELQIKITKEQGITFKPKVHTAKAGLNASSNQEKFWSTDKKNKMFRRGSNEVESSERQANTLNNSDLYEFSRNGGELNNVKDISWETRKRFHEQHRGLGH